MLNSPRQPITTSVNHKLTAASLTDHNQTKGTLFDDHDQTTRRAFPVSTLIRGLYRLAYSRSAPRNGALYPKEKKSTYLGSPQ